MGTFKQMYLQTNLVSGFEINSLLTQSASRGETCQTNRKKAGRGSSILYRLLPTHQGSLRPHQGGNTLISCSCFRRMAMKSIAQRFVCFASHPTVSLRRRPQLLQLNLFYTMTQLLIHGRVDVRAPWFPRPILSPPVASGRGSSSVLLRQPGLLMSCTWRPTLTKQTPEREDVGEIGRAHV